MRIRSIRPEFWKSLDITKYDYFDRLLFIGLWSYVDDNGVGLDRLPIIIGELFPDDMSRDPRETLARVSEGLQYLADGGQIVRYERDGRALLYIQAWDAHQKIDRPGKARYERPASEDMAIRDTLARVSRHSREAPSTGEGEKGRRGEGEKGRRGTNTAARSARSCDRAAPDGFEEFWDAYPRRVGKPKARAAYGKALDRGAKAPVILDGLRAHLPAWSATEARFIPHPATWLNRDGWADDPPPPPDNRSPRQRQQDALIAAWAAKSDAERDMRNELGA